MQTDECHDQLQNGNADTGHQSARLPHPIVSSESEEKQHGGFICYIFQIIVFY